MNGVQGVDTAQGQPAGQHAANASHPDVQLAQEDLTCPVCRSLLRDPFVTACGHSFCYPCVSQHLAHRKNCPSCAAYLTFDLVYPNFLLQRLAARVKAADRRQRASVAERIHQLLRDADAAAEVDAFGAAGGGAGGLSDADLEGLLSALHARKQALQQRSARDNLQLLLHFLNFSREAKRQKLEELNQQLRMLENDIQLVKQRSDVVPEEADDLAGGLSPLPHPAALLQSRLREASGQLDFVTSLPAPSSQPGWALPAAMPQPQPQPPGEQPMHPVHATVPPLPGQGNEQHERPGTPQLGHEGHALASEADGGDGLLASPDLQDQPLGHSPELRSGGSHSGQHSGQHSGHHSGQHSGHHSGASLSSLASQPASHPSSGHASGGQRSGGGTAPAGAHASSAGGGTHPVTSSVLVSQPPSSAPIPSTSAMESLAAAAVSAGAAVQAVRPARMTATAVGAPGLPGAAAALPDPAEDAREKRRKRVAAQLKDLQQCYLALRSQQAALELDRQPSQAGNCTAAAEEPAAKRQRAEGIPMVTSGAEPEGLAEFSRMLSVFTHFGSLKVVAQVPCASARQSAAILSSIEFDRDATLFATAGVSKRICIFDFATVMRNPLETQHRPHAELSTRSKLSCLSWNKYLRPHLISSDYEGVVALWDVSTGQQVADYEAHDKRIWTVDFCHSGPMHFISGSDDGWVKIWSTKEQDSLAAIDMKANVCCVKYNPGSPHQIAIGSADHCVHVYDLRRSDSALHVLAGHDKAVAYVRWMDTGEVVSASTDSTLRLWDLKSQASTRTYRGHLNEKNFVGLSADGEFIACGSEQNEIHVYYKSMSRPIATQDFSANPVCAGGTSAPANPDATQFISAVCWKPRTNTLLAANSSGVVKVSTLTHD